MKYALNKEAHYMRVKKVQSVVKIRSAIHRFFRRKGPDLNFIIKLKIK